MEFSLVYSTTKTKLSQMTSNSKLERELVSIIYHAYIINCSYLCLLYIKHVKQSKTLTLCPFLWCASTHIIRQKTENTYNWEKLQSGNKNMFASKIPLFYFSSLTYSLSDFEDLI